MIPSVRDQMLGTRHCNGTLGSDKRCGLQCSLDDFVASTRDNLGKESDLVCLSGVEGAGGIGKLSDKRVVACDVGKIGKRADIRCETNVDFL